MTSIKHILVIRLSAMGDVAMTIPILRAFEEQYPEVKITVLTREFFTPFFRDLKNTTVLSVNFDKQYKGLLGLYKLAKVIRKLNVDAVVDLHNVLRTKIIRKYLWNTLWKSIDKGRTEKKALTSGKLFTQLKTTHNRYAEVFQALGFSIDFTKPSFPKATLLSDEILSVIGNKTSKWIGIAPFAQYESKMYPLDKMKEIIKVLSKNHKVILFGSAQDANILNTIEATNNRVLNLAGKLSLDQELDVISNLDLMISMDSGNAHIAAMLGIKVITIWGVTHPYTGFYPFNQPEDYALLPNKEDYPLIPTSVYGNKYPESYKHVSGTILEETIINKINAVLG